MKHNYRLISAALLVALSTLLFVCCNKKEDTMDEALKQGEATLARIMDFKQKVDYYQAYPNVKDGESVTLDEAIWNIEALFNLTYSYPELSYGHTVTADTVLYLPVQADNSVLLTDLTVFYGQMYEVVRAIYQGIDLDNKQFLVLDVEAGERHGNLQAIALHSAQGSVKRTPTTPPSPPQNGPFEEGVVWKYGEKGGMLNGNYCGEMDAADTLTSMLNHYLVSVAPANYEYYYTNIQEKRTTLNSHYTNTYPGFPNINPRYCEFFKENPTENDYWMVSDQLNYYYFGERHLLLNILPNDANDPVPTSHYLSQVIVKDEKVFLNTGERIGHYTIALYGHREIVGHGTIIKENLQ